MSVDAIKAQVVVNLQAVTNLVQVIEDPKFRAPINTECPAAVVEYDDPWLTAVPLANSLYKYLWHFSIAILVSPDGVGRLQDWIQTAEPIPAALITRFAAHNTLNNTATSIEFDTNFPKLTGLTYLDTKYIGFIWRLGVFELPSTPFAP